MAARLYLDELLPVIDRLAAAFSEKGKEFDDIVKSARTHLQDAVPIRLGQEFAAYGVAVKRCGERIRQASRDLEEYIISEMNNYKRQVESKLTSFAQLAVKVSEDPGSKERGGLYELNRNERNGSPFLPCFIVKLKTSKECLNQSLF